MGRYTEALPKGMLLFRGRTLLEWQLAALRCAGIGEIVLVTGYRAEKINFPGVSYLHNAQYAETNMLETLMCARDCFNTDILVAYSDILYSPALASQVMHSAADIGVAVDADWRELWMNRYGTTETDLESLEVSADNKITGLGRPLSSSEGVLYRYIGLLKFSQKGLAKMLSVYDAKKRINGSWTQSGNPMVQGYMTDLLHELILDGNAVIPVVTKGGWYEFDTETDYEIGCRLNLDHIVMSP